MLTIDVAAAAEVDAVPVAGFFEDWVVHVLRATLYGGQSVRFELSVRLVGRDEMQALNREWRDRDAPTNVLSFPADLPLLPVDEDVAICVLGDLVLCPSIVEGEARAQGKASEHHWAHLVTHGILHLRGHDHETDAEAKAMEALEIRLLSERLIPDPYGARAHPS